MTREKSELEIAIEDLEHLVEQQRRTAVVEQRRSARLYARATDPEAQREAGFAAASARLNVRCWHANTNALARLRNVWDFEISGSLSL